MTRAPMPPSPASAGAGRRWDPLFDPLSSQRRVPRCPEAGPGSSQRAPGPRAQEGRLGGRCPNGRATAASASLSLTAPARGPAGLGSQSPATGPPGTRLGRDRGCAKAAEVPAAAPNNQKSSSSPAPRTPHPPLSVPTSLFSDPTRNTPCTPFFMHPPPLASVKIILWGGGRECNRQPEVILGHP